MGWPEWLGFAITISGQHPLRQASFFLPIKLGLAMMLALVSLGCSRAIGTCPFRKFYPAWIRIVRQNRRIIESDVCDPARVRNVRR
jgi:hypothetical protein